MSKSQKIFTEIPVLDVSPLVAGAEHSQYETTVKAMADAAHQVGFMQLVGHGLEELQDQLLQVSQDFFALPDDVKREIYIGNSNNHRGYVPFGEEIMASGMPDTKEAFDLSLDLSAEHPAVLAGVPLLGPNQWPDVQGFKAAVNAYYNAAASLGREIFVAFSIGLGLEPDVFLRHVKYPPSQLRLLHYPYNGNAQDRPGIGEHTDYECFTLLKPTAPGLEVFSAEGTWIPVPYRDDALVLNIGDLLELWTNGYYVATSHRVKQVKEERYSFPMFFTVDYETVISPLENFRNGEKVKTVNSGEHLLAQVMQSFRYQMRRMEAGEAELPGGALPYYSLGREAKSIQK
ncbi:isopenicillin N synthase family dioxygenase [Gilvimarinus agarilyticus]|uniref:isopenicillin N synthase family dioxygenase n=1 Tax=Gilvimarinus agarilyticus TaxID=679259 RepID=UPI0005A1D45B|nr:2-oxoglutarate and iron-dependent oxygenase domain-containing protein [Gilvimarinus agarilyticus]